MKRAVTLNFGNLPTYRISTDPYDPNKLGLGELMSQVGGSEMFAGPIRTRTARPNGVISEISMNGTNDLIMELRIVDSPNNQSGYYSY